MQTHTSPWTYDLLVDSYNYIRTMVSLYSPHTTLFPQFLPNGFRLLAISSLMTGYYKKKHKV